VEEEMMVSSSSSSSSSLPKTEEATPASAAASSPVKAAALASGASSSSAAPALHLMSQKEQQQQQADYAAMLEPAYQMAVDGAVHKLKQVMPEAFQTKYLSLLTHFINEYLVCAQKAYHKAVAAGKDDDETMLAACTPQAAASRMLQVISYGLKYGMGPTKYTFDVSHQALRGMNPDSENGNTVDFYAFGCDFFRPCMDLQNSAILGLDNMQKIVAQLQAGENVVLFANHQSEADPQVVSCLLERAGYSKQAADMVYVAGHKVTTDALAVAFSMGRNLICIHSKKHINADPELKAEKSRQNMRAMSALLDGFKRGGSLIWVAPSGGRDRRNVETGDVPIADFDSKTIDMFRLMGNKSKKTTHYYTFAMVTYDLCPPPDFVVPGVGEDRNVRFVPVGIAIGDECQSVGGLECRHAFNTHAQAQCDADYQTLLQTLAASTASLSTTSQSTTSQSS
jgi:glycerol-3-phosphate O-acyltransferase